MTAGGGGGGGAQPPSQNLETQSHINNNTGRNVSDFICSCGATMLTHLLLVLLSGASTSPENKGAVQIRWRHFSASIHDEARVL